MVGFLIKLFGCLCFAALIGKICIYIGLDKHIVYAYSGYGISVGAVITVMTFLYTFTKFTIKD